MGQPPPATTGTPAQRHLALWLLRREEMDRDEADDPPTAAERSCQKLCARLALLVTAAGCQSLLARAIHLAVAEAEFLRGVHAGAIPGACLEGLRESTEGVTPEHTRRGLVAVVAHLVGLLALFVGDDITARLVLEVWPDAPLGPDSTVPASREARS